MPIYLSRPATLWALALLCAAVPGAAQSVGADTTRAGADSIRPAPPVSNPWITKRDVMFFGGAVASTALLAPLDVPISHEFGEPHWQRSRQMHRLAGDVAFFGGDGPFVASAVLLAAGSASGATSLQRFGAHNMEAIALATAITGLAKGIAGRALPGVATKHEFQFGRGFHDSNGPFVSFPSGHTAAAFAMAATVSGELGDRASGQLIERIAYGAAGAVGVARVFQRVHWASDLPLAVLIGTWSGRTVQAHTNSRGKAGDILRGLSLSRDPTGRMRLGWSSLLGAR